MTARSEDRGVQVEARTLSGVHIGQRIQAPWPSWSTGSGEPLTGNLLSYVKVGSSHEYADPHVTVTLMLPERVVQTRRLAPTDLVTLTDGGAR